MGDLGGGGGGGGGSVPLRRLSWSSHGALLPCAVRRAFDAKRFTDTLLYPARVEQGEQDQEFFAGGDGGGANFVRCNSSALASASPLMRRILRLRPDAGPPGPSDFCLSLDCSLGTLRQLALLVHTGRTEAMSREQEQEFKAWAEVLEIGASFSREPVGEDSQESANAPTASDGTLRVESFPDIVFRCPFCYEKAFSTVDGAVKHLDEHKKRLANDSFYFREMPSDGQYLQSDHICSLCSEVVIPETTRVDSELRRKYFSHRRECEDKLTAMQKEIKAKKSSSAAQGTSGRSKSAAMSSSSSSASVTGAGTGISCDHCGRAMGSNMAKKKHMAKCPSKENQEGDAADGRDSPDDEDVRVAMIGSVAQALSKMRAQKKKESTAAGSESEASVTSSSDLVDPTAAASAAAGGNNNASQGNKKKSREIKCGQCGEVFATKALRHLHTCADGRRTLLDRGGVVDEREARKVKPEAGALKEVAAESPPGTRTRGGRGGGRGGRRGAAMGAFNVVNLNRSSSSVDGGGGGAKATIRVTEEDIHRRMVEFEDNKPGKTKRARDKDGKGGEDSSEEEEEEETPSPSKRARDAGGDDLLSSESSDDDILDDDLDLQEEEKEASPPPPPPPKQTTITTLSFAAADEDEALSTESEESDDEDRSVATTVIPAKVKLGPAQASRGRKTPVAQRKRQPGPASKAKQQRQQQNAVDFTAQVEGEDSEEEEEDLPLKIKQQEDSSPCKPKASAVENVFSCPECGKGFPTTTGLQQHGKDEGHRILDEDDEDVDF